MPQLTIMESHFIMVEGWRTLMETGSLHVDLETTGTFIHQANARM
ncbi:hypothetical protein ACSZMT_16620 [Aeromonas veronii]